MTRTGRTGGGRADCGGRADRRTWSKGEANGRTGGGRADGADGVGGRADGWADGRTSGRADGLAGGRTGGQADGGGHAGRTSGRGRTMGGRADGLADWRMGGRGRTGGRRISEGKTPNLTRHLTWPREIQRGRPRITVKLPDLPPLSR